MRFIIVAVGAILALASVTATPTAAQNGQKGITQSFNSCVDLARQRGWTESDLDTNQRAARNFVINCMQGGKARAQKQKTKKAQKTQR